MSSDYGSLLSLDSFASEESIRVAAYSRALAVRQQIQRPPLADQIATAFIDFVGDERWRLDALDVALRYAHMRSTVESIIEQANEVSAWAKLPAQAKPDDPTIGSGSGTEPKATVKKTGGPKKSSR
jgi:hypothetical protein